jgi:uncharacterized protein YdaU (DUF1376 family)
MTMTEMLIYNIGYPIVILLVAFIALRLQERHSDRVDREIAEQRAREAAARGTEPG